MSAIVSIIEGDNLAEIKSSKFYSLIFDESTDISVKSNIVVYIRFVNSGVVHTKFLTIKHLQDGVTAADIHGALLEILNSKDIPLSNLIALGTDGASTMVGKRNGVTTKFKNENSNIISVHCAAHRLALASSQAANKIPGLVDYQATVNCIYAYFRNSNKNTAGLAKTQEALQEKTLKFVQTFGTRWLSFHNAVKSLIRSFDSLMTVLIANSQNGNTKQKADSNGLLKKVQTFEFVATTYYLMDALQLLNILCLGLQKDNLSQHKMLEMLEATVLSLTELKIEENGDNWQSFLATLPENWKNPTTDTKFDFKNAQIPITAKGVKAFLKTKDLFIANLLENLNARFGEEDDIIKSFEILDPKSDLPEKYETEYLQNLATHFSTLVDADDLKSEYKLFQKIKPKYTHLDFESFWREIINKYNEQFPNLTTLGEIYLVIPPTTVQAERGFSRQNLTKTDIRSNLKDTSLNNLMIIKIEGPDIDTFPFERAFEEWVMKKQRRISLPSVLGRHSEPSPSSASDHDKCDVDAADEVITVQ